MNDVAGGLSRSREDAAFGWPGLPPRWTTSVKDAVGTAYSGASRLWFTLAGGIVTEVYYPTVDRPQIRDLQLLITDGQSFVHEEGRDLVGDLEALTADGRNTLGFRQERRDPDGRYRLVKHIIADPHAPCLLVNVAIEARPEWMKRLRVYALLAPHLDGAGAGNSGERMEISDRELLVAWKGTTHLAFAADTGFTKTSCGFVGASDGWQDLHGNFLMDWSFPRALDGNIALTGEVDLSRGNSFTLGIAFGERRHAAATMLIQSLSVPFGVQLDRFKRQWRRAGRHIRDLSGPSGDGGRLYRLSHSVLHAHEDKTYIGARIASAGIPWGDHKGDEDTGGYHLVWTRDMFHSATAMLACGDVGNARGGLIYLACSQRPDGGFPQNFWLDGTPYWTGIQLDQVAFPVLLAWHLWRADGLRSFDPYPMVRAAAAYLIRFGPMTQQERWEEAGGYSPSTLAVSIAALICAADFAHSRGEESVARFAEDYADFLESRLEAWTVTTEGVLHPDIPRHFIRIHPVAFTDFCPNEDPNAGRLVLANTRPGEPWEFPAKEVIDGGFLELVRYGIRRGGDPLIEDSLAVVDRVLKVDTPVGPCWHRYNRDGYGDRPDGGPFLGWGKGRAWPLLTGERGHYELAAGRDPAPYIRAIEGFACKSGMLPEQVWDEDLPERGIRLGRPAGSVMPLVWSHAEYIKLLRSAADGAVFDRIAPVAERYLNGRGRRDLEVWKPVRRVRRIAAGQMLRVMAAGQFLLRWSADGGVSWHNSEATPSGLGIGYVDLPTSRQQIAPISFTFFWREPIDQPYFRREAGTWEGQDYRVEVE